MQAERRDAIRVQLCAAAAKALPVAVPALGVLGDAVSAQMAPWQRGAGAALRRGVCSAGSRPGPSPALEVEGGAGFAKRVG